VVAYCAPADLLIGDIPLAGKYGNGTAFVQLAADEIDSQIGHIYITPIVFNESTPLLVAKVRPAKLLLKKINTLLASGRILLDMAAGGEDDNLHAYGQSLVAEALVLLTKLMHRDIILTDAPLLPDEELRENTAATIIQEDDYSLVGAFYDRMQNPSYFKPAPIAAYTTQRVV